MSNTKIIAKNTLFLYFRMFLILGVTLYTSRVILEQLGVSDFGIYSIVGGLVSLIGFFNSAMSSATQRYLSFDIGLGDFKRLKKTFSTTLTIHIGIALIAFILAETVGLWYINNKMVFPPDRMYAVNIVYQFSVLTFLLNIIQVPYNSLILARERMSVYAYVSVLEAILKLIIVYLLVFGEDKLILFSVLTFVVAFIIRIIYQVYCRRNFKESKYSFVYDKLYLRELLSYSGWNLFGNFAAVSKGQGVNMILNLFYGTLINAAYGIANQAQAAVLLFVNNFQLAINPSLIKNYAKGNINKSLDLMFKSSKFSFYLTLILVLPVIFETKGLLFLWLGDRTPNYTALFVQLGLISVLIDSISGSLMMMVQASGRIKAYQIIVGGLIFLNLPLAYLAILFFNRPELAYYVSIIISILALCFRLVFVRNIVNMNITSFVKEVISYIFFVSLSCFLIAYTIKKYLFSMNMDIISILLRCFIYLIFTVILIFIAGINNNERRFMLDMIFNFVKRKFK